MDFFSRDVRALAEALFSGPDGPPPASRLDWLVSDLGDFAEQAGVRARLVLTGGIEVATWVAPTLVGKLPPLSRLSIPERCAALDKLEHTPFGLPLLAAKAMLCIVYYEHPDALREIGVTAEGETKPSCLVPLRPVSSREGAAS